MREVKHLDGIAAEQDRSQRTMAALDALAPGGEQDLRQDGVASYLGKAGADQRVVFGKEMASGLAGKVVPPGAQKALAPSGSAVIGQEFKPDPVALGQPALSLLDVLPTVRHSTPEYAYLRQTTRTNLAAVVPEGNVKPTSVYSVTRIEDSLDVIAHLSEAIPRYWLSDNASLQSFLENELRYGLSTAVQAKVLVDIDASSPQTQAYSVSPLVTLRKSLTLTELVGHVPAAIVVHPSNFEAIELALSTTNAVEHVGLPYDPASRRLYGVPLVVTVAETPGIAHVISSGSVALDTDSSGVQLQWSENATADSFSRNLVIGRLEARFATSIYSPLGVVKASITAGS